MYESLHTQQTKQNKKGKKVLQRVLKKEAWLSFFSQNDVALAIAIDLSEQHMKEGKQPDVEYLKQKVSELYQEVPE